MELIHKCIGRAIEHVNRTQPIDQRLEASPGTPLLGNPRLDSLGLVNLIVETEMALEEEFGREFNLADRVAVVREVSPFETLDTLAEYVAYLLRAEG